MSQKSRQGSLTPLGLDHVKDVMKPRPGRLCVSLNPLPVTELASELRSAPSQGRDTRQLECWV